LQLAGPALYLLDEMDVFLFLNYVWWVNVILATFSFLALLAGKKIFSSGGEPSRFLESKRILGPAQIQVSLLVGIKHVLFSNARLLEQYFNCTPATVSCGL
jgi:hypothetical protein